MTVAVTRPRRELRMRSVLAIALVGAMSIVGLASTQVAAADEPAVSVVDLLTEGAVEPLGVDNPHPGFSWRFETEQRAVLQSGYRIQVATSAALLEADESDVWDSGVLESDTVMGHDYDGPALATDTPYFWRVFVETDTAGGVWSAPTSFRTGLSGEQDADWIGLPSIGQNWTDYTVEMDFQIEKEAASVLFRNSGGGNSYMWQFNVLGNDEHLTFKPHARVNGTFSTLASIPVSEAIVPTANRFDRHSMRIVVEGATFTTFLDGVQIDQREDTRHATGGLGFRESGSESALFSNMKVTAPDGEILFENSATPNPFTAGSTGTEGLTVANQSPILASGESFTDFELEATAQITSEAATIYFRSNRDGSNSYMWQLNAKIGDGLLVFKPHVRVGGGYSTIATIPIDESIVPRDSLHDPHVFSIKAVGNTITTSIDGVQIDERQQNQHAAGTFGFRASDTESAVFSDFTVRSPDREEVLFANELRSIDNPFTGGAFVPGGLRVANEDIAFGQSNVTPQLRTEFTLDQAPSAVERATWYTSAQGIYEARINGSSINNDRLAPGWTDYRQRTQYQSTDVTENLVDGANALAAQIAPGWFAGEIGWFGPGQYGTSTAFWGTLLIHYADGSTQQVGTNDSWRAGEGPLVYADLLQGERYDERMTTAGWDSAGFDDSGWLDVLGTPVNYDLLMAQVGPPVQPVQEMPTVERTEVSPGVYVFDLGQQISGVVRLRADGPSGTTISLKHAQAVNPDGTLYWENLTAGDDWKYAAQLDTVTLAGGETVYEPRFTYHGFRYVEVSGYPGVPELDDITGIVISNELKQAGAFATGQPMLDQLQSNIEWSLRSNLVSVPTDTNARAERLGWAGDATFSADVATYNWDVYEFYRKWMHDLVETQEDSGLVSNLAPNWRANYGGYGGGWGDAIVAIPHAAWQRYGDLTIVEENYAAMKKWLLFLEKHSNGSYLLGDDMGQAGDWMSLNAGTSGRFTATAYFAWDAQVMADMARALGEDADAERFDAMHESIQKAYAAAYISPDGTVEPRTQAAYIIALYAGLVPEAQREAAIEHFIQSLAERDNHLSTGFVATGWLLPLLSQIDRQDLADQLLLNEDFPSWGYMVNNGATTIWERWDFIDPNTGTFHSKLNGSSDNHAVFGSVGDWMYREIGGVTSDPEQPGYRHFTVRPDPRGSIQQGEYSFQSRFGLVSSTWSNDAERGVHLDVNVPPGTTSTVEIPIQDGYVVHEGGIPIEDLDGAEFGGIVDGRAIIEIGSGTYAFTTAEADDGGDPDGDADGAVDVDGGAVDVAGDVDADVDGGAVDLDGDGSDVDVDGVDVDGTVDVDGAGADGADGADADGATDGDVDGGAGDGADADGATDVDVDGGAGDGAVDTDNDADADAVDGVAVDADGGAIDGDAVDTDTDAVDSGAADNDAGATDGAGDVGNADGSSAPSEELGSTGVAGWLPWAAGAGVLVMALGAGLLLVRRRRDAAQRSR